MKRRERAGLLLALSTALISGLAVFLNGYGVRAVKDAAVYTTGKNAVSALVLAALAAVWSLRARHPITRPVGARQSLGVVLVGVVGGSAPFVLFFEGLSRESSVNAAFLQKTLVVWVSLLAVPVLHERLGALQAVAIGLLVVGQAMAGGSLPALLHMPFGSGEAMILGATLLWAVEVVLAKRLLRDLSSWTVGLARMVLGSTLLVGWLAAAGRLGALTALDADQWRWVVVTGTLLAAYVATWFAALARAQAVDVTAVLVVGAPITAVLSSLIQHAPLRPLLGGIAMIGLGGALILGGRLWLPRRPAVAR